MRLISKIVSDAGVEQGSVAGEHGLVYTLPAGTYYADLADGYRDRTKLSVQWTYGSTLVATITIEATNYPTLELHDAGWAETSAEPVSPAGSAGTALQHYADFVAGRARAKIVVATPGDLDGVEHSKEG